MKPGLALAVGAAAFLIVATANSGGYRYGISDQAFYVPALAVAADASYFPRDAVLFAPQMRWWLGDDLLAPLVRLSPENVQPFVMFILYGAGLLLLFTGGVFVARGLGASWWAVAGAVALLTLRHRIAKTGANSLEGYMHPRMLAFALGLIAFGFILRRRLTVAAAIVAAAAIVHPTTALWFAAVLAVASFALIDRRPFRVGAILVLLVAFAFGIRVLAASPRMDADWLAVIGDKDYLFSHAWPAYAWVTNLLYPVVILLLYRRRRGLGQTVAGEGPLVAGLLALVAGFAVSVPLAVARIAPVVQLQVNRVFWLLDAVAIIYVAWWLIDVVAARRRLQRAALTIAILLACARGGYILFDTDRSFVTFTLPSSEWISMMREIDYEPKDVLVLADPGHAWKYGTSVRVAAMRDVVLEQSKDSAMAMYDRSIAMRVLERTRSLAGFETFPAEQYLEVGRRYGAHVLVVENTRPLALPRLYENGRFALYDLR